MASKLIVTNQSALTTKYGAAGWAAVLTALNGLVAADATRGVTTTIGRVDDARLTAPVTDPANEPQNKAAVDELWGAGAYDYLLILGAPDVIPHQTLKNPVGDQDDDPNVPSDLPYACSAGYGTDISQFLSPTRAVSRLPDVTKSTQVGGLLGLVNQAAAATPAPAADYQSYLGATASVWTGSSNLSLNNIFGAGQVARVCPPSGPNWTPAELARRTHFFNCHGSPGDPTFYGQLGDQFPPAHLAANVDGRLTAGTLLAAECCYGAELYDPITLGVHPPMANTYLESGCAAYLGSTNIAYGPGTGNGQADLMCQYFLIELLQGQSVASAGLRARIQFVKNSNPMGTTDLKTIGQYLILGDASAYPVEAVLPHAMVRRGSVDWVRNRLDLIKSGEAAGSDAVFPADTIEQIPTQASPPTVKGLEQIRWRPEPAVARSVRSPEAHSMRLSVSPTRVEVCTWRATNAPFPLYIVQETFTGRFEPLVRVSISK